MKRSKNLILSIETSCDDTSVALVDDSHFVVAMCSADQIEAHSPFGGVVPEIASRNHIDTLLPLADLTLEKAGCDWNDVAAIAVTSEPGLMGSLLVGVVTAKSLSLAFDKPLIGVNHLEGHIFAPFLKDSEYRPHFALDAFPYIALAVSGGHTSLYNVKAPFDYELLGTTIDDAAGEAFDKLAKALRLGFPGGVHVDNKASQGDRTKYQLPRALNEKGNLNYSFSGLKTAALNLIQSLDNVEEEIPHICASFQEAVTDSLISKLGAAIKQEGADRFVITGGVSANSRLRERAEELAESFGLEMNLPPLRYCTDNAAMIGLVGWLRHEAGLHADQTLSPQPKSTLFKTTANYGV